MHLRDVRLRKPQYTVTLQARAGPHGQALALAKRFLFVVLALEALVVQGRGRRSHAHSPCSQICRGSISCAPPSQNYLSRLSIRTVAQSRSTPTGQ